MFHRLVSSSVCFLYYVISSLVLVCISAHRSWMDYAKYSAAILVKILICIGEFTTPFFSFSGRRINPSLWWIHNWKIEYWLFAAQTECLLHRTLSCVSFLYGPFNLFFLILLGAFWTVELNGAVLILSSVSIVHDLFSYDVHDDMLTLLWSEFRHIA